MQDIIEQIDAFLAQAKNLPVPAEPCQPTRENLQLVFAMLLEELQEMILSAVDDGLQAKCIESAFRSVAFCVHLIVETSTKLDLSDYLDGAGDLRFVAAGAIRNCGICPELLDLEICRSNLTKFRPGHRWREDGKLLKSPEFEPPDLRRVIEESKQKGGEA